MVLTVDAIRELTAKRGVSGCEDEIRAYLFEKAQALADEAYIDRVGNIVARKKGAPGGRSVLLSAHMDEVGFIVLGIGDDGLLAFSEVGSIDARVVVSKRVLVGEKKVPGVIGAKAIHLQSREEMKRVMPISDMRIDIGAKSKDEAAELVSPGDYVSFDGEFVSFGDGFVKSRALDDRVGCLTLLRVLESERFPVDVTCVFTAMEEWGIRGAGPAGFGNPSDLAVNFEGTSANDIGDVPEHSRVCVPGKGVAISFMDRTSMAHMGLFRALKDTGNRTGVPWQIKTGVAGGNDAGPIQRSRGARPVAVLSVPCRNIHSGASVCKLSDIDAQYELIAAFLRDGARI